MATITVDNNLPTTIDVNTLINSASDGKWKIVGTTLVHDNVRDSYIDRVIPELTEGTTYRVTYVVSTYTSCNVRVYLGDTAGTIRTSAGTFVETLVMSGQKKVRFWADGNVIIQSCKIEELITVLVDTPVDMTDTAVAENKSWTLSYNPILEQWISFHSYLPNNYLLHPTRFVAKRNDTQLKLSNSGDYGKYFNNTIKLFILETVFNDNPLFTKVFDNITVNVISEDANRVSTNKFFDKMVINTEYQLSGELTLNTTNLTKKERNWTINKFADLTNSSTQPLFTKSWADIKTLYPIDKTVNTSKINTAKPWYQQARFRDKFLSVRFIENNTDNNKITVKFVSSIFRQSQR